jgi:hypothetical protein
MVPSYFHGFSAEQIWVVLSKHLNGNRPFSATDQKVLALIESERRGELGPSTAWSAPAGNLNSLDYKAMEVHLLSALATSGDRAAYDWLQVVKFNEHVKPGNTVKYVKSDIEGNCFLKTAGPAYKISVNLPPMVDLEFIGRVFLCNVEAAPQHSKSAAPGLVKSIKKLFEL